MVNSIIGHISLRRIIVIMLIVVMCCSSLSVYSANTFAVDNPRLVQPSVSFVSPLLKGIKVDVDNPLKFSFIIDSGEKFPAQKDKEYARLIRYFMAGLTTKPNDLWVNLSPYEKERVVVDRFVSTEMGEDMLSQDYLLKQLSASLTYPETEAGKKYWQGINNVRAEEPGNTPANNFQKIWILPDKAHIVVSGNVAFITESRLKVMTEEDYLARNSNNSINSINSFKKNILPLIEREVNSGKNFAALRQIYNSLILATWFKRNLRDSVLGKNYCNQGKVTGINRADKNAKEKIYENYLEAFKKGAYDLIKTERSIKKITQRRYFSGGAAFGDREFDGVLNVSDLGAEYSGQRELRKKAQAAQSGNLETVETGLVAVGQTGAIEVASKLAVSLDPDLGFNDMGSGIKAALAEEFDDKVVMSGGLGISGSMFGGPQSAICTIAIPVLGKTFKLTRERANSDNPNPVLEIEVDGEVQAYESFLPRLREMIEGADYQAAQGQCLNHAGAKLKAAILADDTAKINEVFLYLLHSPGDEAITQVIDAAAPVKRDDGFGSEYPLSSSNYLRLVYVLESLRQGYNGYRMPDALRQRYDDFLTAIDFEVGHRLDEYRLFKSVSQYAREHQLGVTDDSLRGRLLEYLLFQDNNYLEEEGSVVLFSLKDTTRALGIDEYQARRAIDELAAAGYVREHGDGYLTRHVNIVSAMEVTKAVVGEAVSKKYDYTDDDDRLALNTLARAVDGRILDFALFELFNPSSPEGKRTASYIAGDVAREMVSPEALVPVVKKYYSQIKAEVLPLFTGGKNTYLDDTREKLLLILELCGYIDQELADAMFGVLSSKKSKIKEFAHDILLASGRLVEGEAMPVRLIHELGELNAREQLFSPQDIGKINDMEKVLKGLSDLDVNDGDLAKAREIAMILAQSDIAMPREQTRALLSYFLDQLVELTNQRLQTYGKMTGAFYRGLSWDSFQSLLSFLKSLRAGLRELGVERNTGNLFAGVDKLVREQDKEDDTALGVRPQDLPAERNFSLSYLKALDRDSQLALLKEEYGLSEEKITVYAENSMLVSGLGGRMAGKSDGSWEIGLRRVDHNTQGYILAHEFLHIRLIKSGLFFSVAARDGDVAAYLHELHNMIQDYLIEKEMHRRFGDTYADLCGHSRDAELEGHLSGVGAGDDFSSFMLALTSHMAVSVYPRLRGSRSFRFMGEAVQGVPIDDIKAALNGLSADSSVEEFQTAVLRVHDLLTDDKSAYFDGNDLVVDERAVRQERTGIANSFGGIKKVFAKALLIANAGAGQENKLGGVNFKEDSLKVFVDGKITVTNKPAKKFDLQGLSEVIISISPTDWRTMWR